MQRRWQAARGYVATIIRVWVDSAGDVHAALDERIAVAVEAADRYGDCAGEPVREFRLASWDQTVG